MRIRAVLPLLLLSASACATDPGTAPPAALFERGVSLAAVAYTGTDISTGPNDESYAWSINDRNEVVGWSNTSTGTRAWMRDAGGSVVWLPLVRGATGSTAHGISPDSRIVGSVFFGTTEVPAYWARATVRPVLLPTIGGQYNSAFGVNVSGLVVGSVTTPSGQRQAFAWEASTGWFTPLGTLGGATSEATDVNTEGFVTGFADDAAGAGRAFRWSSAGGMSPADAFSSSLGSSGYGINNKRQVAGYYFARTSTTVTALFDLTNVPQAVYRIKGLPATFRSVNDAGVAVGHADPTGTGIVRALSFSPAQGLTTLPGITGNGESRAMDINYCGRVVGWEVNTAVRATLWVPAGC